MGYECTAAELSMKVECMLHHGDISLMNSRSVPLRFGRILTGDMRYNDISCNGWEPPTFSSTLLVRQKDIYEECKNTLNLYDGLLLELYPGFGKTVMAISLSCEGYPPTGISEPTLIIVHRKILLEQWKKTIENFTDGRMVSVASFIEGNTEGKFFVVAMDTEMDRLPIGAFGTLIIDEAHSFCTAGRIPKILTTRPNRVICCSATPKRNDGMHVFITSLCGYYSIIRSSPKPYTVMWMNTGAKIPVEKNTSGRVDWSSVIRGISESAERKDAIIRIVGKETGKILILTNTVMYAKILSGALRSHGENVAELYGKMGHYQDSRILVGTLSKIGTGFDEETGCDDWCGERLDVLIMACSFKDLGILQQVKGRVDRSSSPIIYEFCDGNGLLVNHFKIRLKWYKESGLARIRKIQLDDYPPRQLRRSRLAVLKD